MKIIYYNYECDSEYINVTFVFLRGSPPSSKSSTSVARLPYLAATCIGVMPSSVALLGPAPDFSNIRAHLSPEGGKIFSVMIFFFLTGL